MNRMNLNRISFRAVVGLSAVALLTVISGYFQPAQSDEGVAAHIFQLSIVMLAGALLLFFATLDRSRAADAMRRLITPAALTALAFALLYHLEHYYYVRH